jgi:Polyketide cyclase / dehydrase and lipid transport
MPTRSTLLVRGDSLGERMSEYLISELRATPNVSVQLVNQHLERDADLDPVCDARLARGCSALSSAMSGFGRAPHSEGLLGPGGRVPGRQAKGRIVMGHLGGSASIDIDAPLEVVWGVVEDVITAPEWQGGLDRMSALEHDAEGRPALVETENDVKVRRIKSHVRFRYEGPTRLSWTQEKGDMKSVDGAWDLEDLGDGRTRATYTLDADPGRVLGLVIRGPVEAATRAIFVSGRPGELKRRVDDG